MSIRRYLVVLYNGYVEPYVPSESPRIDENGIDLDLLDYCLALTPSQRLEAHAIRLRALLKYEEENGIEHDYTCEYDYSKDQAWYRRYLDLWSDAKELGNRESVIVACSTEVTLLASTLRAN